jgi:ribosomal protein L11 methyltransferase
MNYFKYVFSLSEPAKLNSEIVLGILSQYDFEGFEELQNQLVAFIPETVYPDLENEFITLLKDLQVLEDYTKELVVEKNWNEEWEKNYFKPITIGKQLYVRSSFHEPKPSVEMEIIVDPKMSFGTGHHQTTKMILETLEGIGCQGKTIMDMGCGTAILAIYCAKKGAARLDAVDIDEWSVENALENIALNKVHSDIQVYKGDVRVLEQLNQTYDIFIANINLWVLLQDLKTYLSYLKPNAILLISGFLEENIPQILNELEIECEEIKVENSWCMMKFVNKVNEKNSN